MNNNLLQLKFKLRLNKLASNDYDNIESWMIAEAINKEQNEFVRSEARKGEDSTQNVDDLQVVLKEFDLNGENKHSYYESKELPGDHFATKRVSIKGVSGECKTPRPFIVYDAEEANLDVLLRDENTSPSFEWGETFKTHINNRIRVHTNGVFNVAEAKLIYYRQPRKVSFAGGFDEFDQPTPDVECEFKDDVVEMLIDRAAATIAGDLENINQFQRLNPQEQTRK